MKSDTYGQGLLVLMALLLACGLWYGSAGAGGEGGGEGKQTPNVLIVLADDQGWGDLSLHGNKDLATPHIDSLARDGVSFDRFYVCAVCAPTRAEFLTGRYHPRTGVHGVSRGAERLNLDERTVAEAFQAAGYATGCFGKWHNGMQYPYHPRARGFDTFVGFCSGHWGDYFDAELERDGDYFKSEGYITDVFADEAIGFIEQSVERGKPFFCYVPLCTPHSPMQVPDKYWDRHKDKQLLMEHPDQREDWLMHTRAAYSMVENIDDNVGRLLAKLDELDIADDTIVVYFSDNGPNGNRWNASMRGVKGSVDEGGLRSPLLIRWPKKIVAGSSYPWIAGAIDLSPTLAGLAEIERVGNKPQDGLDLAPALIGEVDPATHAKRVLYANQNGRVSMRTHHFRLDHKGRFYDMGKDPGQTTDIAADHPGLTEQYKASVAQWREEVGLNKKREPRPFTVGHKDWPITELPARDATTRGGIKRSSPHPNCSYFYNWTSTDDAIEWDVEVLEPGAYGVYVYYTCPAEDIDATIELSFGQQRASARVVEANDPPVEGEKENRVYRNESFVKDFKPMDAGLIRLEKGRGTMTLRAADIPGGQAMEFRRLMLVRQGD